MLSQGQFFDTERHPTWQQNYDTSGKRPFHAKLGEPQPVGKKIVLGAFK